MQHVDALAAARILVNARRSRVRLEALPAAVAPADSHDAYQIQDLVITCFGEQVGGWKVGATHANSQAALGTTGPVAARLFAASLHPYDGSTAVVLPDNLLVRGLEAEYAFLLGEDLSAQCAPYTRAQVLAAVASVHPSIEVVDTRFKQMPTGDTVIADNVGDCAWIYGAGVEDLSAVDMLGAEVVMEVNGEAVVVGNGAEVLGDPITSLLWLVNQHASKREGLRAGQFITAGSCTGLFKAPADCRARATFTGLGTVEICFETT